MGTRRTAAVVFSIAALSMVGCKTRTSKVSKNDGGVPVTIDLGKYAPMGYEFSGKFRLIIPRGNLALSIDLPDEFPIAPSQQKNGEPKAIVFNPGKHEVGLFKNLQSGWLLEADGYISDQNGVLTLKVKMDTAKFPNGQYVLGISGDPYFAYCPLTLQ